MCRIRWTAEPPNVEDVAISQPGLDYDPPVISFVRLRFWNNLKRFFPSFRVKMEQLETLPEGQGRNLASNVLYVLSGGRSHLAAGPRL